MCLARDCFTGIGGLLAVIQWFDCSRLQSRDRAVVNQFIECKRRRVVEKARLAQSVERLALNQVVVGSSPTVGAFLLLFIYNVILLIIRKYNLEKERNIFLKRHEI